MNRRGLLLLGTGLLVGEPVRRAYSFLQANPLALEEVYIYRSAGLQLGFSTPPSVADLRQLSSWVTRYYGAGLVTP